MGIAASLDELRGTLALGLGRLEAAEQHFIDGREWSARSDVRFGLVEGRCLQGLAAIAEARGDEALAIAHLDAAGDRLAPYRATSYLGEVIERKLRLNA